MSKQENNKKNSWLYGVSMGLCFGVAYGIIFDNLALGIAIGMCFGTAFGAGAQGKNKDDENGCKTDK